MTSDLITFINSRLREEQARATALQQIAREAVERLKDARFLGREIPGWFSWPDVDAMCTRTLRDVDAKRTIVQGITAALPLLPHGDPAYQDALLHILRTIAAIWSDHPDYQP